MTLSVGLLSLATAVPPYVLMQDEVAATATRLFGARFEAFERVAGVFRTTGIRQRRAVRPIEWYIEPKGWPERTEAYLDGAARLYVEATRSALERAGLLASAIDIVVTVSSTGIATPSLEARVAREIGFHSGIRRVPIFGLGCAGGVAGLALAARLARAEPGKTVLVVAVELCTLAFRLDELSKANIVATALFGDGAAAAILRADAPARFLLEAAGDHTWPDTLDIMGWNVDPTGFGVIFARAIPPFAEEHLSDAVDAICAREGIERAGIDRFICHPGGSKVILALEAALGLAQGSLDAEREILSDFGNMSAPTVLFVLERLMASALPRRALLTAMGPGFTASCAELRAA
jgi:alkylresorcinol/alkylpyrone synthase